MTGLSEFIAPWATSAIAARRRWRICSSETASRSTPSSHLARLDPAGRPDQAHQRQRDRRFARAGFADQSEALAVTQVEADTVDGPHRSARRVVVNAKVANLKNVGPIRPVGKA